MRLLSGDARTAVFGPLDDGAVRSESVTRRLGSAIALGLLDDGEQLPPESDLATSLNVSTVTLRDALAELRRRGLVTTRRGRGGGSFVRSSKEALDALAHQRMAELGTTDLRELGDYRCAIAGTTARLAAHRASEHEIARLRELVDRFAVSPTAYEQRRIDGRYYIEIAAATQSPRLTNAEIELQSELGQLMWFADSSPELVQRAAANHHEVIDAIAARDADAARTAAEQHIELRSKHLVELRLRLRSQTNLSVVPEVGR